MGDMEFPEAPGQSRPVRDPSPARPGSPDPRGPTRRQLLAGAVTVAALPRGLPAASPTTEFRGLWITRWSQADAATLRRALLEAAQAGFNSVFVQVRGTFDAWWPSRVEPWAASLLGPDGRPTWNPLAEAVRAGHAVGLQVHAWINALTLWRGAARPPDTQPPHALAAHPDWAVRDLDGTPRRPGEGYLFAEPGLPAVRERLAAVAREIAAQGVDGLHLDYIRYPDARVGLPPGVQVADRAAWQRDQVTAAVGAVRAVTDLPLTAAVWGVYRNRWGWPAVTEGWGDLRQDPVDWVRRGLVDAVAPMIYWPVAARRGERLDFTTLVRDHVDRLGGGRVLAGVSAERQGLDGVWTGIEAARAAGAAGIVLFDWSTARPWLGELAGTAFRHPAVPPDLRGGRSGPRAAPGP